jgi:magnesium-protoporphyrin O-methyltransferase
MSRPLDPPHASPAWSRHQERVEGHFRQGAERWTRLTSESPVSRIRRTVRAGRAEMREILLQWLPDDLSGQRVLDAGCGTGVMSWELARRGAEVVGVDLAEELVDVARSGRNAAAGAPPAIPPVFRTGDMVQAAREGFDWVVAMDCFIHYPLLDTLAALRAMEGAVDRAILLTVAPWTPLLGLMHGVGKIFPRGDRAPGIIPVRDRKLRREVSGPRGPASLTLDRNATVHRGFYISRALELRRRGRLA